MQTAFAAMFAVESRALAIQESCQPVERVVALLRCHDIDPSYSAVFFSDPVHDDVFLFPFSSNALVGRFGFCFSSLSIC